MWRRKRKQGVGAGPSRSLIEKIVVESGVVEREEEERRFLCLPMYSSAAPRFLYQMREQRAECQLSICYREARVFQRGWRAPLVSLRVCLRPLIHPADCPTAWKWSAAAFPVQTIYLLAARSSEPSYLRAWFLNFRAEGWCDHEAKMRKDCQSVGSSSLPVLAPRFESSHRPCYPTRAAATS
jgi:hypothetical protein